LFLADELIPKLAGEYPIGKYRILAGHSNAGKFSLYAFIERPEVFQANIALSPSYGLDDRFVALLGRALAKSSGPTRFVFLGAGGDEEPDISVGALRFAKTFEGTPSANVEYHYEVFPGETHGSVGLRAYYRRLEVLGQADPPVSYGPGRYLSEAQRRRQAWVRRFGSAFQEEKLPRSRRRCHAGRGVVRGRPRRVMGAAADGILGGFSIRPGGAGQPGGGAGGARAQGGRGEAESCEGFCRARG